MDFSSMDFKLENLVDQARFKGKKIVHWHVGDIITHVDCGGIGVVCYSIEHDDYESPEPFVSWVIMPDWSKSTSEPVPKSVWLSSRQHMFKTASAIQPHECGKIDA